MHPSTRALSPLKRDHAGFTLVELMVTLSVLAVLLGVGVPSFRSVIQSNRMVTTTNDLVAAFQFARSEAVRRGVNVTVCASNDQSTCSGTWANGWVVRPAAGAGAPFRVWPALRPGITLAAGGNVVFTPLGASTATLCYQLDLGSLVRRVNVGPGGRVSVASLACP